MNVHLAAEIKQHVSKPVATIGAINDPAMMEEILETGKADVIYMARELLADPFLPNKVVAGSQTRSSSACVASPAWRSGPQPRPAAVPSTP